MTPGILNCQEIKSDLNSKMLNFNMGFAGYSTCLKRLKNHYSVNSAVDTRTLINLVDFFYKLKSTNVDQFYIQALNFFLIIDNIF